MRLRLLLLLPATSWAETTLRPADSARLDNLDAAFGNAVMQALAAGDAIQVGGSDADRLNLGVFAQPVHVVISRVGVGISGARRRLADGGSDAGSPGRTARSASGSRR